MKKLIVAFIAGISLSSEVVAQNELSNFTATGRGGVANTFANDYQVIGINPANLGRNDNAIFAFSIGEMGIGVNSKSLTRSQLNKFIYNVDEELSMDQKKEFAAAFTNEDALNVNLDLSSIAFSINIPAINAGIAFSNRQRVATHIGLNKNGAEILFMGKDAPVFKDFEPGDKVSLRETLAPTSLQMSFLNEFNLAVGSKLIDITGFKLMGGLGYKYIQGIGVLDLVIDEDKVTAYSALSPVFDVNYGDLVNDPNFNTEDIGGGVFKPVGIGHGFDLGAAAEIGKMAKASVSVTDIGTMVWQGNLLEANDQYIQKISTGGINSFNLFKEVANLTGGGNDSLFTYTPNRELKSKLPTKLRFGAGYKLTDKIETGLDVTFPLNEVAGNLASPFVGVGLDFKPIPFIRLSSGFSAGAGYGANLPLGFTFVTPVYEFGVATRDVLGLFSENNPYLSVAFGFLRFRFGMPDPM